MSLNKIILLILPFASLLNVVAFPQSSSTIPKVEYICYSDTADLKDFEYKGNYIVHPSNGGSKAYRNERKELFISLQSPSLLIKYEGVEQMISVRVKNNTGVAFKIIEHPPLSDTTGYYSLIFPDTFKNCETDKNEIPNIIITNWEELFVAGGGSGLFYTHPDYVKYVHEDCGDIGHSEYGAQPKEGMTSFYKNIASLINDRMKTVDIKPENGVVFVEFDVLENGELDNFSIKKGINEQLDNIAIDVIKNAGDWCPAIHMNKPIKQTFTVPVKFRKPKDEKNE